MEAVAILISCYIALYAVYVWQLVFAFGRVRTFADEGSPAETRFTIVIPFRNEEKNLPGLLHSLEELDYPKEHYELIFIDDFSSDGSGRLITRWRLDNPSVHSTMIDSVRISDSPKKDAIQRALPIALHPWIVTTDADCRVPEKWLILISRFILQKSVRMVCGPVAYDARLNPVHHYQQSEFMALQGVAIGAFGLRKGFMCNAANLAFEKQFFHEIGGFSGVDDVASGDDVFLLQKAILHDEASVGYLKSADAVVVSRPVSGIAALFNQRVRWASKAKRYLSRYGEMLSLVAFFGNLAMLSAMILALAGYFDWWIAVALFVVKFLPDFILSLRASLAIRRRYIFPVLSGILYPLFSSLVGLYSLYGRYWWKGRYLR